MEYEVCFVTNIVFMSYLAAVSSVTMMQGPRLTGGTGEELDLAPGVARHQHVVGAGQRGRPRVGGVAGLAPHAEAVPLDHAVTGGPVDVPDHVDVPHLPAAGGQPDHDLVVRAVGLDVAAVLTPVHVDHRCAVTQTSALTYKLTIVIFHLGTHSLIKRNHSSPDLIPDIYKEHYLCCQAPEGYRLVRTYKNTRDPLLHSPAYG